MSDLLLKFVKDANEALELKLVRVKEDLENEKLIFKPDMTHQVFGENENIFGYSDITVQLYYTAASLQTYLGIKFAEKLDPKEFKGLEADDIPKKVSEILAPDFTTSIDEFLKRLDKDKQFKPFGKLEHVFQIPSVDGSEQNRTFEVYFCEVTTPGFLDYHQRLQTFLLWYIDAASFIDTDDDQWTFFLVYEKYKTPEGDTAYATVGYTTVYRYYAYPKHTRPRISQVLVLPPFQRIGICAHMLQAIYNHYTIMTEVLDITVEDPSQQFQRIRDYVDAKNLQKLPSYQPEKLKKGFTKEMAKEAQSKYRVCAKQARRVYEILRLKHTNVNDPVAHRQYRLDVKNRLNAPFQKKKLDMKKLEKVLSPSELAATATTLGLDETHKRLSSQYSALEEEYNAVILRLEED